MKLRWPLHLRSLTIKLILIYLTVMIVGVVMVGGAMRFAFRDGFRDNIQPHLALYVDYLRQDLSDPPSREQARALTQKIPVQIHIFGDTGHWSTDGSPPLELDDLHYWRRNHDRGNPMRFGYSDDSEVAVIETGNHTIVFVTPDDEDDEWRPAMVLPLLVVIGIFAALYFSTRRLFAPLRIIRSAVNQFGGGDLEKRLDIKRKDELGEVAQSFNQMADRIQQMLESKRQLLLAISHELRSPLTRAKLATAMLSDKKQRDEIDSELGEMDSLVSELLETERFNAGHQVLNLELIDITALLRDTATAVNTQITLSVPKNPLHLQADAARLKLVIKNLLENACKYTPNDQPAPDLRAEINHDSLAITINDNGPGIAAEHLPHISEPFYRVDPARQRATGGYGLGLYLCRVIIEAHGGEMRIDSTIGQGTAVSLAFPIK